MIGALVNDHDVQHRDCFDSLAAMRHAGGVRLIVTSPPYPDARTPEQYGCAGFDTSVEGYGRLGEACFEALVPGGVVALNIDGPVRVWRPELGESERSLIAFEVALDWAKRVGFRYVEHVAKAVDGFPISGDGCNPRWRAGWEPVHIFARPGAVPYFDRHAAGRPARYAGTLTSSSAREKGGKRANALPQKAVQDRRCLMTCERWLSQDSDPMHAAPFVGSGTVAFSCHRHGRRFIGGDLGHRERDGRRWADIVNDGLRQTSLDFGADGQPVIFQECRS